MDRTKRVNYLKKIIIGSVVFLIVLPTVLCIVLFVQLSSLKKSISSVVNQNIAYEEEICTLKTQAIENQMEVERLSSELQEKISELNEQKESIENLDSESEESAVQDIRPGKVYLTFDDGPSGHTQDILDILDEYGVKGNFFVCHTKNEEYQKFYKMIIDKGHMLGIHSYSHVYDEIYSSEEAFSEDVSAIRDFVYEVTDGYIATNYRFPGGSANLGSKLSLSFCVDYLKDHGMRYFDWNISSQDATNPMQEADVIFNNSTEGSDKFDEVVILMHDLGNKDTTVEALPRIIEYYKNIGSEFSILDENTIITQYYNK